MNRLNPNPEHSPYDYLPEDGGWQINDDDTAKNIGTLEWYDAHIDAIAEAEKRAIRAKLTEYGLPDDDVFGIIKRSAETAGTTPRVALMVMAARHCVIDASMPVELQKKRALDRLGYDFLLTAWFKYERADNKRHIR